MKTKNGCRVLVVDDDTDNREGIVALLEQDGYLTAAANNGAQALQLLEQGLDPDLVLTDLTMPIMSGWDLCETLKSTPHWRSIPVIVLCGMAADTRGRLHVDDTFEKPTDSTRLLARIGELCGL